MFRMRPQRPCQRGSTQTPCVSSSAASSPRCCSVRLTSWPIRGVSSRCKRPSARSFRSSAPWLRNMTNRAALREKEASPQTEWMNDCVPRMMDKGKPQDQAVAICLHMFYAENPEAYEPPPEEETIPSSADEDAEKAFRQFDPRERRFDIALVAGRSMLQRLGLSDDEIDDVFDAQTNAWDASHAWFKALAAGHTAMQRLGLSGEAIDAVIDRQAKAYDESEHPRDEHGRWTDAGGGDGGGGGAFGERWAEGSVGHEMAKGAEAKITHVKGSIEEVRQQAVDACVGIGDSKFECGVIISRGAADEKGVKVAVVNGEKDVIDIAPEVTDQFSHSEFHHNHPDRVPLSGPDITALNSTTGMFGCYAHTVDGGLSKATIPGRNNVHPNRHWGGDIPFERFMNNYFNTVCKNQTIQRLNSDILRVEKNSEESGVMTANYILLKGLENAGIIEHEFKPSPWQRDFIRKYDSPLKEMIKVTTDSARFEMRRAGLRMQD